MLKPPKCFSKPTHSSSLLIIIKTCFVSFQVSLQRYNNLCVTFTLSPWRWNSKNNKNYMCDVRHTNLAGYTQPDPIQEPIAI